MSDNSRWQIMFENVKGTNRASSPIENFSTQERAKFQKRKRELAARGTKFTVWDTRNNALSKLFSF